MVNRLYRFRIKVLKGDIMIANLSVLFAALTLLISPHLVLIAALAGLALGYRVTFDKQDASFMADDLKVMTQDAVQKVKSSIDA